MEKLEALAKYREIVTKNPDLKNYARRSFYDTYKVDPEGFVQAKASEVAAAAKKGEVSQKARPRLATAQAEGAKATYEQEMTDIKARTVGETAAMLPFAAAAPFTGGTSVPAGMTVMGLAGLAGGVAREQVKAAYGSSEMPESGTMLALSLGLDTAFGSGGEGLGRTIGYVAKSTLPAMIQRSAQKSDAGAELLKDIFVKTRDDLYGEIKNAAARFPNRTVNGQLVADVEAPLKRAYDALGKLPRAKGKLGQRFSSPTPKAGEILKDLEADLQTAGGGSIAANQPLDGLVRMKGNLQKMAWDEKSLNREEVQILKKLATDLDGVIKKETARIGAEAAALYKKTNDLFIVEKTRTAAGELAHRAMRSLTGRAVLGASVGASYGSYSEHTVGGALGSAALGAAVGAASKIPPALSTFLLEKTLAHPTAAPMYRKAIGFFIEGREGEAANLARRAFIVAGARDIIKDAVKPDEFSMKNATEGYIPQP